MPREIFRREALDRIASPEQLDQLMPLTSPQGWIALLTIGVLMLASGIWSVVGWIPTTVTGSGLLERADGVHTLQAPAEGVVAAIPASIGEVVETGHPLIRLSAPHSQSGPEMVVKSPRSARVLDILVNEGETVSPQAPVVLLEFLEFPMEALLYVPLAQGYQVEPGMPVHLHSGLSGPQGRLRGQVKTAGRYPVSRVKMAAQLRSADWAEALLRSGPCLEVVVEFTEDQQRAAEFYSGAPCQASITAGRRRPIELILPHSGTPGG